MKPKHQKTFPKRKHIFACPETILLSHPDATALEVDTDILSAIIARSISMIEILSNYYDTPDDQRSSTITDAMIDNFLWQLSGNLHLVQQIIETAPMRAQRATPSPSKKSSDLNKA